MWGTKFSREPGRARASQPGAFVPAPEREQCPAARLEAGFGPIPQFGSLEPPGGVRRPVAWGASGQRIREPLPAPLLSPAAASAPCPSPWENVARRADRSSCRRGGVGGRCPALGFLSHTPALVGQRLHQALAQGSSARPPAWDPWARMPVPPLRSCASFPARPLHAGRACPGRGTEPQRGRLRPHPLTMPTTPTLGILGFTPSLGPLPR